MSPSGAPGSDVRRDNTVLQRAHKAFSFRNCSLGNVLLSSAQRFFLSLPAAIFLFSSVTGRSGTADVIPAILTNHVATIAAQMVRSLLPLTHFLSALSQRADGSSKRSGRRVYGRRAMQHLASNDVPRSTRFCSDPHPIHIRTCTIFLLFPRSQQPSSPTQHAVRRSRWHRALLFFRLPVSLFHGS